MSLRITHELKTQLMIDAFFTAVNHYYDNNQEPEKRKQTNWIKIYRSEPPDVTQTVSFEPVD